jgi:hypothetical protein
MAEPPWKEKDGKARDRICSRQQDMIYGDNDLFAFEPEL